MTPPTPSPLTAVPDPQFVMSVQGHRIATYTWGDEAADAVLCVHGFSSRCRDNRVDTGWVRDLTRAGLVLGGIPDGTPLVRLKLDQARAFVEDGTPITDPVTRNYVTLSERVAGNDLRSLIALAEGMRLGMATPTPRIRRASRSSSRRAATTRSSSAHAGSPRRRRTGGSSIVPMPRVRHEAVPRAV